MGCPFYKRCQEKNVGTCEAARQLMVPSIDEQHSFCERDAYDECSVYQEYIGSFHKHEFAKILQDP